MQSKIVKRSIVIRGHKTSVSLEEEFFTILKVIAINRGKLLTHLVDEIDSARSAANLSSAIRLYVVAYLLDAAGVEIQRGKIPRLVRKEPAGAASNTQADHTD